MSEEITDQNFKTLRSGGIRSASRLCHLAHIQTTDTRADVKIQGKNSKDVYTPQNRQLFIQPEGEHNYYLDKSGDPDIRRKIFQRNKQESSGAKKIILSPFFKSVTLLCPLVGVWDGGQDVFHNFLKWKGSYSSMHLLTWSTCLT